MIKVGDIVLHTPSGLYYRCENKKQEKWMNEGLYTVANGVVLPPNYFAKST